MTRTLPLSQLVRSDETMIDLIINNGQLCHPGWAVTVTVSVRLDNAATTITVNIIITTGLALHRKANIE